MKITKISTRHKKVSIQDVWIEHSNDKKHWSKYKIGTKLKRFVRPCKDDSVDKRYKPVIECVLVNDTIFVDRASLEFSRWISKMVMAIKNSL